jgi:hypothetical protein
MDTSHRTSNAVCFSLKEPISSQTKPNLKEAKKYLKEAAKRAVCLLDCKVVESNLPESLHYFELAADH